MKRLLILIAAVISCGDPAEPVVSVTGTWSGTASGRTILMELTQSGTTITGTAKVSSPGAATTTYKAAGTFNNPSLAASFTSSTDATFQFSYSANLYPNGALVGNLNGLNFNGASVSMQRQP
jgi:hypothetical protein